MENELGLREKVFWTFICGKMGGKKSEVNLHLQKDKEKWKETFCFCLSQKY